MRLLRRRAASRGIGSIRPRRLTGGFIFGCRFEATTNATASQTQPGYRKRKDGSKSALASVNVHVRNLFTLTNPRPARPPFPAARSKQLPFLPRSVAPFPHNSSG